MVKIMSGDKKICIAGKFFFNVRVLNMRGAMSLWDKENFGKLFIRLLVGLFFVALGIRYFSGGMSSLQILGAIFNILGITFWPSIWGIFSAVVLILSGMCFLIGFFFRTNCALLLLVFFLKLLTAWFFSKNFFDSEFLLNASLAVLLFAFLFMGAGRFSSDGK
ncbi:MAG: hypothetical protein LBD60_00325 [Puniceicoccales bacterium]|jgi:putative oxidoreductase|nr:hypothetical protein [Puniceicoccales bacterium]